MTNNTLFRDAFGLLFNPLRKIFTIINSTELQHAEALN
jgi:hypothetical protein